jgi:hypothetical protein
MMFSPSVCGVTQGPKAILSTNKNYDYQERDNGKETQEEIQESIQAV